MNIIMQNINQLNMTIQNINEINRENIDQLRDGFNQTMQNTCQLNKQNTYQLNETMQTIQTYIASNDLTIMAIKKAINDAVALFKTKGKFIFI